MLKRDFVAIAELLRQARLQFDGDDLADFVDVLEYVSRGIANVYADRNDRFDRDRLLRACRLPNFGEVSGS